MPIDKGKALLSGKPFDFKELSCVQPVQPFKVDQLISRVHMPKPFFDFVTITLNPKLFANDVRKQFDCTHIDVLSILEYLCSDFTVIAELTQECNIHYHAWVLFREKYGKKSFKELFRKNSRFGYTKITKEPQNKSMLCQQHDTYRYLVKELEVTYRFLRTNFVFSKSLTQESIHEQEIKVDTSSLDSNPPYQELDMDKIYTYQGNLIKFSKTVIDMAGNKIN